MDVHGKAGPSSAHAARYRARLSCWRPSWRCHCCCAWAHVATSWLFVGNVLHHRGGLTLFACSRLGSLHCHAAARSLSSTPPPPLSPPALGAAPQNVKLLSPLYTVCDPFLNFFRGTLRRGRHRGDHAGGRSMHRSGGWRVWVAATAGRGVWGVRAERGCRPCVCCCLTSTREPLS